VPRALDGTGVGVEGFDRDVRSPGRRGQGDRPPTAAEVEHAITVGDLHGVDQVPGAGIDPAMRKHAGARDDVEQAAGVAKGESAVEIPQPPGSVGPLDDVHGAVVGADPPRPAGQGG
jgi:hypothetical protein